VGLIWNILVKSSLPVALIQTELVQMRRREAERLGADSAVSPREMDLKRQVLRLCPKGVDYLIDATGATAAIEEALPLLGRGGTFLSFGICPEEERLSLSLNWLYHRQARIFTSRRPPREMQRAIELAEHGRFGLSNLVTGTFPLEEIEVAFRRFDQAKDQEIKMMIDPWM
jgi:threonine dehydrogenase-like Zn-dependent dehydrogenase